MPLSRRDTIKAAGAAGAIGLLGSQVSAQVDEEEEDEENGEPTDALEEEEAAIRVAHLSSDAPEVDVAIDGESLFDGLAYGDVTEYERGNAGEYPIEIMASADENILLFEDEFELEEQTFYTFAVFGEFRADDLEIEMLEDFNESQIRLVHASPDAPDVDVDADGESLFSDVGFGDTTEYMAVPPGQYTLEVEGADEDLTGDDDDDEDTLVAQVEDTVTLDATLEGGVAYTAWAVGYVRPPGENEVFDVLLTTDGATADREADIEVTEEPEEPEEPDEEEPDEEEPEEPDDEPEEPDDEPEEPDDEPEEPDDEPEEEPDEDEEPA